MKHDIVGVERFKQMTLQDFMEKLPSYEQLVKKVEELKNKEDYVYSSGIDNSSLEALLPWERVVWEDGAGNEANLILFPEKKEAILYGYDHESSLNFFGTTETQTVFNQLPPDLKVFIESETFHWSWATGDEAKTWATCCYWLNSNGEWVVSEEWKNTSGWEDDDAGSYMLKRFIDTQ